MHDFVGANDVIEPARLKELSRRSNGPALAALAAHFGALGLTTFALYLTQWTWWCVPVLFLHGVLITFLYAPEHECDHFTPLRPAGLMSGWQDCVDS